VKRAMQATIGKPRLPTKLIIKFQSIYITP